MTIGSSGSALAQYPVDYSLMRTLLLAARVRAPFLNGTVPGRLERNSGTDSVKWERIENLTPATTPLSELSGSLSLPTRTGVVPTITPITAAMLKYGNTIFLTEEVELMSVNARASKLMFTLGENAGQTYNALMAAVYAAATQIRYANSVAGVTTIITSMAVADIKSAVNVINRQGGQKFMADGFGSTNVGSAPIRSSYMGICHVDVEEDIRLLSGFVPVENYGGYTETFPFEFGALGGVRWCSTELSTLITSDAGTTEAGTTFRGTSSVLNDVYDSYVVAMDAVGSVGLAENHTNKSYMSGDSIPAIQVLHAPPTVSVADPQAEIAPLSWKGWLVGKVLNATWVVRLRTLSVDYSL
ncbi:MAG: N4-gp56 family major capsid protein [Candidatus Zixiibacteriota bacterium]|nr:MAG: N4-gp56 family major capsid protein [candidate division Zixibacteria bacterium]